MSEKYDEYIKQHKENVEKASKWLYTNLPEIFHGVEDTCLYNCEFSHDDSKFNPVEYEAYDAYFYGGNRSHEVVENFNYAWLHHIHNNPHHWQYWILINDDPDKGDICLDMPDVYIIEMICDWWAFSWAKGNLYEIFKWYDEHKDYIQFSDYTKMKVEDILSKIKAKLDESDADETK